MAFISRYFLPSLNKTMSSDLTTCPRDSELLHKLLNQTHHVVSVPAQPDDIDDEQLQPKTMPNREIQMNLPKKHP